MSAKALGNPSSMHSGGAEPQRDPAPKKELTPGLYLVATPIGNLGDITLRALSHLRQADIVACEDTRVSRKLMDAHEIRARLVSYHEHNATRMRPRLLEQMRRGKAVALISDAGTPAISDPGFKLIRAAISEGLAVTALPGPSAALVALLLSGLPSDRFLFAGFLPDKAEARRRTLNEMAALRATLIVFVAARRLPGALADMAAAFGPRPAAVARELTKLHEEVRRDSLDRLAAHYRVAGAPKGEVVAVIGGAPRDGDTIGEADLDARLRGALEGASLRDAVAVVAADTGLARQKVYARALDLTGGRGR